MKKYGIFLILFSILVVIFLYGVTLYPHGSDLPSGTSLEAWSASHWLGTDNLGVDVFAQVSQGFFHSMAIGLAVAVLAFLLGGILGVTAGYLGGMADNVISFLINVFLSVPQLPIMIVIGAFFGQKTSNIILILAAFSWAQIAKQVRAKTQSISVKTYILMAKSYGGSLFYVLKTHLFRHIFPLLLVTSLGTIGRAIIQESSLAFLGLSDPTATSWGMMMAKALGFSGIYFTDFWKWWLLSPVLALVASVLCLRLLAKKLEENLQKEGRHG